MNRLNKYLFPVLGLLLVPVVLSSLRALEDEPSDPLTEAQRFTGAQSTDIEGLWSKYPSASLRRGELSIAEVSQPVQFYYFHTDGIGLFRYGKAGLNNTHSFNYEIEGAGLAFDYRKTGERFQTSFSISKEDGRLTLRLEDDPKDEAGSVYVKVAGPMADEGSFSEDGTGWDRMWTHLTRYKTGGMGFSIYQLQEPKEDGAGIGWFHEGDFDNWSTESLSYQIYAGQIQFHYRLRKEQGHTPFRMVDSDKGRILDLKSDPRNFWFPQFYLDAGKSFENSSGGLNIPFQWNTFYALQ